ncbi:MAG: uracil-DNA glycosylase [Leptospiraceae bacterium]|nr:uracil-DNA glycosylase [Leptospiraceae bacterium]
MSKEEELLELSKTVSSCKLCKLHTTRTQTVFGEGDPDAKIFFIGEGPGATEDKEGRPFVGKAGMLLTRILEKGLGLDRSRFYIANVAKCRPTVDLKFLKDRPPEKDEVSACSPYLIKQIEIVRPSVIVSMGNPATKFLLSTNEGISSLRGNWHEFNGIPVMPTYHPSFVLRNGTEEVKKEIWNDISLAAEKVGLKIQVQIKWKDSR